MTVAASTIEIRWRRTDSPGQWQHTTITTGQSSVTLDGVERGASYQIEARSVALSGASSDWVAQTHIVSALSIVPLPPTSLAATSLADGVHLTWAIASAQRTDTEYDVERTPDLSGAPDPSHWVSINSVRTLAYTDGVTDGVVRWYRVRAGTYGGIFSAYTSAISSRGKTVADGATVGGTIGPGGNIGGAVDSNGRAIVDFTSTHLNKTLDNVGDGSTFKRLSGVNSDNTLHVSTPLNAQGSILPNQAVLINITVSPAAPGILIATFPAQSLLRSDGSSLAVVSSTATNLVTNGDGESGTVGSQAAGFTDISGFGLITVNSNVHSGTKAMNINNTSGATSINAQGSLALTAGKVYVVEGWIKTDALPNVPTHFGGGIQVQIATGITSFSIITKFGAFDAGNTTIPAVALPADGTARGYTFLQCYFIPTANGTVTLELVNQSNGGNVWFDDVRLYLFGGAIYTALAASTKYYLYSYILAASGVLLFANGNPPTTSPSDTFAMNAQLDGRIGMSVIQVTMPASGGSFTGTGGGSGTCPESQEPAYIRRYSSEGVLIFEGETTAGKVEHGWESKDGETKRGDFLKGYSFTQQKDVYRAVQKRMLIPCNGWSIVNGHRVTPCEMVYVNGQWIAGWKAPGATHDNFSGYKVLIQVKADEDAEHNFYIGDLLIHNSIILGC